MRLFIRFWDSYILLVSSRVLNYFWISNNLIGLLLQNLLYFFSYIFVNFHQKKSPQCVHVEQEEKIQMKKHRNFTVTRHSLWEVGKDLTILIPVLYS